MNETMRGPKKAPFLTARELCIMALLTAVLFLQEELLTFLPNIQLTVFLMLLYTKVLGTRKTLLIVTVYLILDASFMGALNPIFVSFQWLGWIVNPIVTGTCLKKTESSIRLAFAGAGFALIYCWVMILPSCLIMGRHLKAYLIADIPFEALLAASSFLSILLLYEPLVPLLRRLMKRSRQE